MQRSLDEPDAAGKRAIMIVDDHAHFRCAMRHWIAQWRADYDLVEAASGEEALALANSRKIHVVLMDIELPGMNGLEATRGIKRILPQIPVIVVSQHAGDLFVERACKAGAFAYVTKDKVSLELLPAIARALALYDPAVCAGTRNG